MSTTLFPELALPSRAQGGFVLASAVPLERDEDRFSKGSLGCAGSGPGGLVGQTQLYPCGLVSALPAGTGDLWRVPPGPSWLLHVRLRQEGFLLASRGPTRLAAAHDGSWRSCMKPSVGSQGAPMGHHPHGMRAAITVTKAALAPCTKAGAYRRGGKHPGPFSLLSQRLTSSPLKATEVSP